MINIYNSEGRGKREEGIGNSKRVKLTLTHGEIETRTRKFFSAFAPGVSERDAARMGYASQNKFSFFTEN
jgi:hypothetical protein